MITVNAFADFRKVFTAKAIWIFSYVLDCLTEKCVVIMRRCVTITVGSIFPDIQQVGACRSGDRESAHGQSSRFNFSSTSLAMSSKNLSKAASSSITVYSPLL